MTVWSILLRLLLTVGLILNGSGYAVASAHMQMEHMTMASAAPQPASIPAATAEPPCAGHHQGMSETADISPADAARDTTAAKSGLPAPDCCKSGACRCACVHPAQTVVPALAFQPAMFEQGRSVSPTVSGHAPPVFSKLIRPPIV